MIELLTKGSLILIVIYGLYLIWFKSNGHWSYNRFILLCGLGLTLIVPLIPASNFTGASEIQYTVSQFTSAYAFPTEYPRDTEKFTFMYLLEIIYWLGVIILTVRLLTGLIQLIKYYHTADRFNKSGFQWLVLDQNVSPTSFFNLLIISKKDLAHPQLETIVTHERCHKLSYHTLDALFIEFLTILFWFHPVLWLIRKEVRECHEFEADRSVLASGQDSSEYQHLLFEMRMGYSLTQGNAFSENVSLLKRYKMMKITTLNPSLQWQKLLPALATFGLIICMSSFSMTQQEPDTLPGYVEGEDVMYKTIANNLKYPKEDRHNGHSGTVQVMVTIDEQGDITAISTEKTSSLKFKEVVVIGYIQNSETIESTGISQSLENEAKRAIGMLGKFTPAIFEGKPIACSVMIPVTFILD
jgi:hypothetical protein